MGIFTLIGTEALATPKMINTSVIPRTEDCLEPEVVAVCNAGVADPRLAGQDGDLIFLLRVILRPKVKGKGDRAPYYYWAKGILHSAWGRLKNADFPLSLIVDDRGKKHQHTVSYLVLAVVSRDFKSVKIHQTKGLFPLIPEESGGIEDSRIVWIEEKKKWLVIYTAVGVRGICVATAFTLDFEHFARNGVLFASDKNAFPLPERVNSEWIWFRRPDTGELAEPAICISIGHDLLRPSGCWCLISPRDNIAWEAERVGVSGPAIKITYELAKRFFPDYAEEVKAGGSWWLVLYHGKEKNGGRYCQGFFLIRFENGKAEIIAQSEDPAMTPAIFEGIKGDEFVKDAIFVCGDVFDPTTGTLYVAVSRADTDLWAAYTTLDQVNQNLVRLKKAAT
jgi:predicted GH43/DUF377 family glycosyl hydrolase